MMMLKILISRLTLLGVCIFFSMIAVAVFSTLVKAQDTYSISVNIEGIKSKDGGYMMLALMKDTESARQEFPSADIEENLAAKKRLPVNGDSIQTTFDDITDGTYALIVFHDANANNKIDSNFLGIPKEGAGFSANPKTFFGPPEFEDAMFKVEGEDVDISISMVYILS